VELVTRIVLGLFAVAIAAAVPAQELTGTLKKIKDTGSITLAVRASSIPFSYYNDKQETVGYSYDIALDIVDAVKKQLKLPNLEVKRLEVTPANRIQLIQNGTVDLECGSTTNNIEREKQVDFSDTIFIIGTRLLANKSSGVKDFPDLAGKNVVTTAGTTSEQILRKMNEEKNMHMNLISAKDHGESFLTLQSGRAVAFMMDDALLAGERAKARNRDEWVIVGTPQSKEAYGCMLRKDDAPFKKVVDDTIAQLETSGQAAKLYHKWFQSPIPPKDLNLNFTMNEDMVELFKHPNDKPYQ